MDDVILTGLYVKSADRIYNLDDPKDRQRYVRTLNSKQKQKLAKLFMRKILQSEEYQRWFNRMLKR
jgi:hypothetical protein